jgi:hypothetical protein
MPLSAPPSPEAFQTMDRSGRPIVGFTLARIADARNADEIALMAGYDPVLGAAFFSRLPDPGDRFLGTHPPNAERQAEVARVVARLRRGS